MTRLAAAIREGFETRRLRETGERLFERGATETEAENVTFHGVTRTAQYRVTWRGKHPWKKEPLTVMFAHHLLVYAHEGCRRAVIAWYVEEARRPL